VRVAADNSQCAGHTLCNAAAPEVFGLDDEGYVVLLVDGELPAGIEGAARAAVAACPERALSVLD
jgi:ferredoxin